MKNLGAMKWSAILVVLVMAILCFGPWRETRIAVVVIAISKVVGLLAIFFASLDIFRSGSAADSNRANWLILGLSFLSSAFGQSWLCYNQIIVGVYSPFPSLADPFFVLYAPLVIYALFSFCRRAIGSGLSLGSPLAFWWPAIAVLAVSVFGLPLLLMPVVKAGGTWQELFLNIYYPVISFIALAPCTVILRFGIKFRGGNLFWVWLFLTTGFLSILVADIVFAYFSVVEIEAVEGLMDFLYVFGYVLIPFGVLSQGRLQKAQ